jgi:hypothetical protein
MIAEHPYNNEWSSRFHLTRERKIIPLSVGRVAFSYCSLGTST